MKDFVFFMGHDNSMHKWTLRNNLLSFLSFALMLVNVGLMYNVCETFIIIKPSTELIKSHIFLSSELFKGNNFDFEYKDVEWVSWSFCPQTAVRVLSWKEKEKLNKQPIAFDERTFFKFSEAKLRKDYLEIGTA